MPAGRFLTAAIMIGNDRILATNATLALASRRDAFAYVVAAASRLRRRGSCRGCSPRACIQELQRFLGILVGRCRGGLGGSCLATLE
ncbi:MAG: hypothetical protein JWN04_5316 [Myxococcaceae bacterium]|nr:hypothetical protein [Myxococcaceae bacterium]